MKWNLGKLNDHNIRHNYQSKLDAQLLDKRIHELDDVDKLWDKMKENISDIAEEICGREEVQMKQRWMNLNILTKIEERRKYKNIPTEEGQEKYKELKRCVQKLYRQAKDNYFNVKCQEIEALDNAHSKVLDKKIKEVQPRGIRIQQVIKDKQGKMITEKENILK